MNDWKFGQIAQLGYVVNDIDQAVESWSSALGIGPWVMIKNLVFHGRFRGVSTSPALNIALAYQGDLQIELIQPLDREPSPYLPAEGYHSGPHHVGYLYDQEEFDKASGLADTSGLQLEYEVASVANARYRYYTLPNLPQCYVEFVELDEGSKELFENLKAASAQEYSETFFTVLEF